MKSNILMIIILLVSTSVLIAQPNQGDPEQQFTIEREYKPSLADAVKVQLNPELPPIESKAPVLTYNVPDKYLNIPYEAPDVRPLAMKAIPLENLKNVYAKIGAGNRLMPYVDIYLNSGRNERTDKETNNLNLGGRVGYINTLESLPDQEYSEFRSKAFATFFTDKVTLGGELNYNHDGVRFYGFDHADSTLDFLAIKQAFKFFNGNVFVKNTTKTYYDISYNGKFDFNYLSDKFGNKEMNPVVNFMIKKGFDKGNYAKADVLIDYNAFKYDSLESKNMIIGFNPAYKLNKDKWNALLGLNLGVNEKSFFIFPDVRFERELIGKAVVFTAGFTGDVVKNNYKAITDFNPFIDNDIILKNSKDLRLSLGLRGALDKLTYAFKVNYDDIKNLPLFVIDTINVNRFNVIYDSTALVLNLHGELGYSFSEKFRLGVIGDYFHYTLQDEDEAWHLPSAKATLYVNYNITDKLFTNAQLYLFNNTWAKTPEGGKEQLKGLVDINLGATYKISESFHIFANVFNVASVKHQRWYNYPSYGLSALAGLALHF